jgi:hypothetical protein
MSKTTASVAPMPETAASVAPVPETAASAAPALVTTAVKRTWDSMVTKGNEKGYDRTPAKKKVKTAKVPCTKAAIVKLMEEIGLGPRLSPNTCFNNNVFCTFSAEQRAELMPRHEAACLVIQATTGPASCGPLVEEALCHAKHIVATAVAKGKIPALEEEEPAH